MTQTQYFGKYRGTVTNNIDPKRLGRVQVNVPSVLETGRLSWAMPCVPYAGKGVGFLALPPIGANVWVEFEAGDLDRPIWTGCFWGLGELPAEATLPDVKLFKTAGVTLKLSDMKQVGGVVIEAASPAVKTKVTLTFDKNGATVETGESSVKLTGKETVVKRGDATATLSASGMTLTNGKATIKLSGSSVKVNDGALEVT